MDGTRFEMNTKWEAVSTETHPLLQDFGKNLTSAQELECLIQQYGDPGTTKTQCPRLWDGLLCWPPSNPGTQARLACFSELNGIKYNTSNNATRWCDEDGVWANVTNYTTCHNLQDLSVEAQFEPGVEITTAIYFAGYTLSLMALIVAVSIFLYFRDLRCLRNMIHTNLMVSYIMADFMWITTLLVQISAQGNTVLCTVLIVLLHYFHLTNFFWMFVEGLYLYILVVKAFDGLTIKLRDYLCIGWGASLVFIIIWATAKLVHEHYYSIQTEGRQCSWMNQHVMDWIYQGPALLVLAINLVFLTLIMWVLITKLRSANNVETQQYRKAAKALFVLIPLLGVTYILFIATPSEDVQLYSYCRAILLSLQGFTVAMFYCFLNSEVQNSLKHRLQVRQDARQLAAGWTSRTKDLPPSARTCNLRPYGGHHVVPTEGRLDGRDSHFNAQMYNKQENTISDVMTLSSNSGVTFRPPLNISRDVEISASLSS